MVAAAGQASPEGVWLKDVRQLMPVGVLADWGVDLCGLMADGPDQRKEHVLWERRVLKGLVEQLLVRHPPGWRKHTVVFTSRT
jgi:hypothetical protein